MAPDPVNLHELYPFKSRYVDVGGYRMHYVDEGGGPAIVMLHGNPTWSFYYRTLIMGLRDRYRVIAPDHVGCGLSDKPQKYNYTLATHIDNVGRLIDRLGLTELTLALHDWGGAIGFGWARRDPERVRKLVLFNTAAFMGSCPRRIRCCRWPLVGPLVVRRLNAFTRGALRVACKHQERMTPEVKRGYLLPYGKGADRIAILGFVRDIPLRPTQPSHGVLREIENSLARFRAKPMLICWGMQDFCFNESFLAEWETRFPAAQVHRFDDAGHYVVEDAHERILPLMGAFLARTGVVSQGPKAERGSRLR